MIIAFICTSHLSQARSNNWDNLSENNEIVKITSSNDIFVFLDYSFTFCRVESMLSILLHHKAAE